MCPTCKLLQQLKELEFEGFEYDYNLRFERVVSENGVVSMTSLSALLTYNYCPTCGVKVV